MAPRGGNQAAHPYEGRATSYGALDLSEPKDAASATGSRARAKVLIVVALSAVSLAAFLFGAGQGQLKGASPAAAVNVMGKAEGDELVKTGKDGWCNSPCEQPYEYTDMTTGAPIEVKVPYGYCNAAPACLSLPEGCMGIDYRLSRVLEPGGPEKIACAGVQGAYDCGESWPCQNGGFCIDAYEERTCICPFGWQGATCEEDINECADVEINGEMVASGVCSENGVCANEPAGAYSCTCNPGFEGDGYAYDQKTVRYYSILDTDYSYGWLHRTDTDPATGEQWPDKNEDGQIDVHGCTDINDCVAEQPCRNDSRCYNLWDGAYYDELSGKREVNEEYNQKKEGLGQWFCDCAHPLPIKRYAGKICDEDVDECTAALNNCDASDRASCENTAGSFKCACNNGWYGDGFDPEATPADWNCLTANYCDSALGYLGCQDINNCDVPMDLGVDEDRDGVNDVKMVSVCKHGGTCAEDGMGTQKYICTCVEGWDMEGGNHGYTPDDQNCGQDIDECEIFGEGAPELGCDINAHCHNTDGSWLCLCNNGWTGEGDINGGCYDADDCEFSPCQHGGTCADCGTLCLICDCIVGWRGKTCEIDWNECRMGIHTCHDFAICINNPGSFDCECEPGYSGDGYRMCEEVNDCARWEDNADTGGRDDVDTIDYGIKIRDDTGKIISKEQPITPAPWSDDMIIIVPNPDGDGMIEVHQCGEWEPATRTWREHGSCVDVGAAAFLCTCDVGWSDSNCDRDIDECARATDMCHKYGTCTNTPGSYYCACNTGYTGDGVTQCHDVDDCTFGPERCYAGRCTDLGAGDFRCVCLEGYMDRLCDRDINECADFTHTCQPEKVTEEGRVIPGAACKNTNGSFKCSCRRGFQGDGIGPEGCTDIDECGSAPCENGTCQDNGQLSYSCTCDYGWTNTNCDFDFNECVTGAHDCHPEGKCVNTPGGYYCRCVSGHTGDGYTCTDLDDCDPDPCDPVHGTCNDNGANKYVCHCDIGFGGMGCEQDEVECMIGTHGCHPNADCFNTYGSHICVCKREFYGDGKECAPCTQCMAPCADNEDFTICPGHEDYNGVHDVAHVMDNPEFCPSTHSCGHGPGYINDVKKPPCAAIDRTCIQINECELMLSDCDPEKAKCTDNEGSFFCECLIGSFGGKQYWGDGRTCIDCTVCGLGSRMIADCTSTSDRFCQMTIPDGNYALETYSGDTAQCLVHWGDLGRIFPERYSWGGRLGTPLNEGDTKNGLMPGYGSQSVGKYEMWGGGDDDTSGKDLVPSPDVCQHPICGVCDYGGHSPGENIVKTMEASWTFRHLEDDLYLMLSGAGGQGFRCLGFQEKVAPYPASIVWEGTTMIEEFGTCVNATGFPIGPKDMKCKSGDGQCAALDEGAKCKVEAMESGEWRTDLDGVELEKLDDCADSGLEEEGEWKLTGVDGHTPGVPSKMKSAAKCDLAYFCGFTDTEVGTAKSKLLANGGAVWNVRPLACQGLMCQTRWTSEMYTVRTMAVGDQNMNNDARDDGRCLYFPAGVGGIPEMTPEAPSDDGMWLGIGKDADADANGDPECGIALREETGAEQNERFNAGGNKNVENGTVHDGDHPTQEKELLINKQAVFRFVPLPAY